jgi:hypothetical protein
MTSSDLAEYLIGKSITAIAGDTIQLSDGTVLEIENTSDCCAWYIGEIEALDYADNIITNVEEYEIEDSEAPDAFSIHVLSNHKLLAKVNVEGDSTSGYYCHSVNLIVKHKEPLEN